MKKMKWEEKARSSSRKGFEIRMKKEKTIEKKKEGWGKKG